MSTGETRRRPPFRPRETPSYRIDETDVCPALTGSGFRWVALVTGFPDQEHELAPWRALNDWARPSAGIEEPVVIEVRRPVFGSPAIARAIGPEPAKPSVVGSPHRPSMLVDEPMVEAADEQQVVEVGGTSP